MLKTVSTANGLVSPTFSGNVTLSTGNLIIGTSGKGIDFSATPGTGTSELLSDYEEGTWTPIFSGGGGTTITSYNVNSAAYTKIGRLVTIGFDVTITNNGTGAFEVVVTGIPFSITTPYSSSGSLMEVAAVGFSGFVNPSSTTSLGLSKYDGSYPGGTNRRLIGSISYNN
tara:strand:+ start:383 stop:892 length:510 start_codon:yes stop_codon:yes gene_type:complete